MSRSSNEWAGQSVSQGRYHVRTQLGAGGMGFVYRALDRNLDTDVVIKVPRRSMLDDPEFAQRFAREIRSLVRLSHPNIVKVTDVGEHDGMPFAVMQYLSGGSLEDYLSADRSAASVPTGLAALGDWLPGIAAALDFVHSQGFVHRDVKPGNILFDAHGHVFLSDFGVAKALAAENDSPTKHAQTAVTGAGLVLGTPEYMAPELIMGQPFDGRIDQYALAVTVYEMLCGRRPFEATSPTACMVMQTTQEPIPLVRVDPRLPRSLSDAVARALAKGPDRRYLTTAAFAAAVLSGAADTAAPAKTPSDHAARSDQVRLPCPSCSKSLVFPAALLANPEKARGKRLSCPSCRAHLRLSDDGGSLVINPGTPTGLPSPPSSPPQQSTRKFSAPRSATVPVARPAVAKTVLQAPPPNPSPFLPITENSPTPSTIAPSSVRRPVPPWTIVAGALGGLLAASVVVAVVLAQGWARPKMGEVVVDTSAVPSGATFSLDGRPVDSLTFGKPLAILAGVHELSVTKDGYEPFSRRFPVSAGEGSGFKVLLKPEAPPAPPPASEKPKETLADHDPEEKPLSPSASFGIVDEPPKSGPVPAPPPAPRPAMPRPQPVGFKPVPDGPPVDKEALASLLQRPETFADRIVVPTGLYVLGPITLGGQDGLATTHASRIALHVRNNNLAFLERIEGATTVRVDPELASNLRGLADLKAPAPRDTIIGKWGDTAAVLTFHVQTPRGTESNEWVPVLKKVEFLVAMNFPRVAENKFLGSFKTITVTTALRPHLSLSERHDWSSRLGVPYLAQLKRVDHGIKRTKFYQEMQVINNAMAPAFNNLLRNSR